MDKYMNKNYKDVIDNIQVKQGTAKDSGNTYYFLELHFINGYSARIFCLGDKQFAIQNALDLYESQQLDSAF